MTSINWPPKEKMKLIGTRIDRLDGPAKSSGAAKYSLDIQRPGLLYGKILGAPIAAGTLKSLDTKAAEALQGRRAAVHVMTDAGKPINWARPGNRGHRGGDRRDRHRSASPGQSRSTSAAKPKWTMPTRTQARAKPRTRSRRRTRKRRSAKLRRRSPAVTASRRSRIVAWSRTGRCPRFATATCHSLALHAKRLRVLPAS